MHPHDVVVGLAVLRVLVVGTDRGGDLGRLAVAAPGHQRRDRAGDVATLVRVVGDAVAHQQRAEVGVAEAELAERAGVVADPLGRIARRGDDDLLREEDDVDRVLELGRVEAAVLAAELHQVERGEVAGRVVDVHVLAARVRGVDPPRLGARVPAVDRRVVLHPRDRRTAMRPRRAGRAARGPDSVFVGSPLLRAIRSQSESAATACMNSSVTRTELLAFWYWIEVKPSPSIDMSKPASRSALAFFSSFGLAPDEVLDVRMVDVEDDHLRRAARLAARLDRPGPGVGAAHERDRAGGEAALREVLDRAADVREVDPGAGAAAEDLTLLGVPVEDRLHRVLDREDEAGGALRALLEADVEPDRAVEGGLLVEKDVGELHLERVGVLVGGEVAALAAPGGDRPGDPADHLLDRALALVGAEPAAEVLLGDDVGRVLRPGTSGTRRRAARRRGSPGRRSRRRGAPTRPRRRGARPGSSSAARRPALQSPDLRSLQRFPPSLSPLSRTSSLVVRGTMHAARPSDGPAGRRLRKVGVSRPAPSGDGSVPRNCR